MLLFDDGFAFTLIDEFKDITTLGWILMAAAAVIAAVLVIFLIQRGKSKKAQHAQTTTASVSERKDNPTLTLVHGALCIALAFVLSYFKLFSMPDGGSITLASMLPMMVYANRYGVRKGLLAGLVYGLLQYIQGGYFVHWIQFLLDYPIAFALIGLAGLTKGDKNLVFSVLIGGTGRFLCHLISGILVFGEYVMIGADAVTGIGFGTMLSANFVASFVYNAPFMYADIAICAIIALLPPFRNAIKQALDYRD